MLKAGALVELPPEPAPTRADILQTRKVANSYGLPSVRIPGSYKGDAVEALGLMREVAASGRQSLCWTVCMPGFGLRKAADVAPAIASWGVKLDEGGLLVSLGTDTPVVPLNPFWNLYHFLTRDTINDGVYGEGQKVLPRERLLKLITINHARMIGEADRPGSIKKGKLADFVVMSDNFRTVPAGQVRDMKALATYVGGRKVCRDPAFQGVFASGMTAAGRRAGRRPRC